MEANYSVALQNGDFTFYLRKTTWTTVPGREDVFATEEAACAALQKAKPYTKPALFKRAQVVPAPAGVEEIPNAEPDPYGRNHIELAHDAAGTQY